MGCVVIVGGLLGLWGWWWLRHYPEPTEVGVITRYRAPLADGVPMTRERRQMMARN